MARFSNEHKIKVGDDGLVVLREPTNKEWETYTRDRVTVRRGKVNTTSFKASCDLLDAVVTRIENIEDDDGNPVTLETLDRIPGRYKELWIVEAFESGMADGEELEKNS